ncbi:cupredoxin domain-containing protein [Kitasatospora sp. NPDC096128]|uniref:cupredoxin domain-containing protein n=1 Tax=Kitasatospora sp. NPDC096128 TaxID=3155547 RepID=UPI00332A9BE0
MTSPRPLQAAAALLLSAALAACSSSGTPSTSTSSNGTPSNSTPSNVATSPAQSSPAQSGAAASSPAQTSSAQSSTGALQVTIKNFAFSPATLTVGPGQQVTVLNQDSVAHTLTASDKSFDTGTIQPGASATFTTPQQTGEHPYTCTIHPFMHGTLTVG